jgi:HD-GYP domain-containing protein (c-di-GMP phosphodiesterase class II)
MTTTRPYREALPVERAIAELRRERGHQFDPAVVDAFLDVLAERPWAREESWN